MSTAGPPLLLLLLLFTFSLLTPPPPAHSLSYTQFQTLYSLAPSLTKRVANLFASRGDLAGSDRARAIAQMLDLGMVLGGVVSDANEFLTLVPSLMTRVANLRASRGDLAGSDRAQAIAQMLDSGMVLGGVVSDANELLRLANELNRMESKAERGEWVERNYRNALRVSRSLFGRLLEVLSQSGPSKEVVETVQKEVVEGGLLRDCLELGSNDLKGLIQIFKDLALQYTSTSDRSDLFGRLLKVFSQSGPLKEVVETVQKEVVEGDLLRDCLELGSNDLKGLIQIFKERVIVSKLLESQFFKVAAAARAHGGTLSPFTAIHLLLQSSGKVMKVIDLLQN